MNWIDCKDKEPEIGERLIVYNTEGAILIAQRYSNGWAAYFSDGEQMMNNLGPIGWMPLPDLPPCKCGFQHDEKYN